MWKIVSNVAFLENLNFKAATLSLKLNHDRVLLEKNLQDFFLFE